MPYRQYFVNMPWCVCRLVLYYYYLLFGASHLNLFYFYFHLKVTREIILLTVKYLLPNEQFDCPMSTVIALRCCGSSSFVKVLMLKLSYTPISMEVAATKELLQIGFDETKINSQSTHL
jgi:hypothetical protein